MLNQLKAISLSDKEARVYLAMLELGPSTVLEIAAKAGVNRPTAYVQIEALKKIGLASAQTKGKKHLFIAESPDQLETILAREQKLLEEKVDELKKVLPELETLYNLAEEKPQVRFFEGKEGLLRMQAEFLKSKEKTVCSISAVDDIFKMFPDQLSDYTPKRVQKRIFSKLIYTSAKKAFLKDSDQKMLRESKYIPPEKFPFSSEISIYGDNVSIIALKGKVAGVIIKHKEIADSFRGMFNLMWEFADKL